MAERNFDQLSPRNVTFEPRCRNSWHVHHGTNGGGDQILMCTAGSGWYQAEGEDPVSMQPGTVITPGENLGNESLEPVTDDVYGLLPENGENV